MILMNSMTPSESTPLAGFVVLLLISLLIKSAICSTGGRGTFSMIRSEAFCDYLDVTYPPDNSPLLDVERWLTLCGFEVSHVDGPKQSWRVNGGVVRLEFRAKFHRVSVSGAALGLFRIRQTLFDEFLGILSDGPYSITRLDVAVDTDEDGPDVLRRLEAEYPDDRVKLSRKASKVTRLYSARDTDGQLTGTWYVGHKSSARITARVYDKQAERLAKSSELWGPRTRYELTFKKEIGCTLRDAQMPTALFYAHSGPLLLDTPEGVPAWESHGEAWEGKVVKPEADLAAFERLVERSHHLQHLAEWGQRELGPEALPLMMRVLERKWREAASVRSEAASEG